MLVALRQWGEANLFDDGEEMTLLFDRRDEAPIRRLAVLAGDGRVLVKDDTEVRLGSKIADGG